MVTSMVTGNRASPQSERRPTGNLYSTVYPALAALRAQEGRRLPRVLWEPHCGTGGIVVPMRRRGYKMLATDLHDWGCPDSTPHVEFLTDSRPFALDAVALADGRPWGIIANPPFDDVEAHIERAVALAPYAAFLLRFAFFGSEGRGAGWFNRVGLQRVHLICDRLPMMHGEHIALEDRTQKKAGFDFAWFIFQNEKPARKSFPVSLVSWKLACRRYPEKPGDKPPAARLIEPPSLFD